MSSRSQVSSEHNQVLDYMRQLQTSKQRWSASSVMIDSTLTLLTGSTPRPVYHPKGDKTTFLLYTNEVPASELAHLELAVPCEQCSRGEKVTYHPPNRACEA